jgi:hypothetical protein
VNGVLGLLVASLGLCFACAAMAVIVAGQPKCVEELGEPLTL